MGTQSTNGNGGLFYVLAIGFIRAYKSLEAVIIRLFLGVFEKLVRKSYREAGIEIDGKNPWDITVHRKPEFFLRLTNHAPLGLGETYVDRVWDCDDLVQLNYLTMRAGLYNIYMNPWNRFLNNLEFVYFNNQTEKKSWEVGEKHYDLGNDLFESFLDPSMNYSCGYWRTATDLTQAQIDKMDLIAKKLMLKPGMKVLDIGCGWGGLCKHLAENYGVSVDGCTVSVEQAKLARERCANLPVKILLRDYRELDEKYDRIVSVGMFEHCGICNYDAYFNTAHRCLKDDGIFLLHTIGVAHHDFPCADAFFDRYIFPNGILPYHKHITQYIDKRFIMEDFQNFGNDYSKTLIAWFSNFERNWPKIESKYGDKFFRLWKYYLLMGAGCFKARRIQLWQVVLSKNGIEGGYYAAR